MGCGCKSAQIIKHKSRVEKHLRHLHELWDDPSQRQTLYECPDTGTRWLRDFPFLYFNDGGPAILRKLPLKLDFSCYVRLKTDLACRCLAISKLTGDAAAEYAQFHLEKKAEDVSACTIEFRCPITNLFWAMEFPSTRVPCGGIPILSKAAE